MRIFTHTNTHTHTHTHTHTRTHTHTHTHIHTQFMSLLITQRWLLDSAITTQARYSKDYNTLQHTATQYNTLQHTATPRNTLQPPATQEMTVFQPSLLEKSSKVSCIANSQSKLTREQTFEKNYRLRDHPKMSDLFDFIHYKFSKDRGVVIV